VPLYKRVVIIAVSMLAALLGCVLLDRAQAAEVSAPAAVIETELRHELARLEFAGDNAVAAELLIPPDFYRLPTVGAPQFFARIECLGDNWAELADVHVKWTLQGIVEQPQVSEPGVVFFRCHAGRHVVVDLGPLMPRSVRWGDAVSMQFSPPASDSAGQPRGIRWIAAGMNYEARLPEAIPGPPGIDGAPGRDGHDGKDGRNGIDGKNGRDGKDGKPGRDGKDCDCDECRRKHGKK
jgi:hypothetical protein